VQERRRVFGRNKLPEIRMKSFLELIWDAMKDPILIVLTIAGIISMMLGLFVPEPKPTAASNATLPSHEEEGSHAGWVEGVAILVSVVIVVFVTAVNDLRRERQFQELKRQQESTRECNVIRGGKQIHINVDEVVVGDVLILNLGAILPADGVLIHGSHVSCDESALTGEPIDIHKSDDKDPWLLSGSSLKAGHGTVSFYYYAGIRVFSGDPPLPTRPFPGLYPFPKTITSS